MSDEQETPRKIADDDLEAVTGGATMVEYAVQLSETDGDPPWHHE